MTLGEHVVADLRADLFKHLTALDAAFYDTAKTGELLAADRRHDAAEVRLWLIGVRRAAQSLHVLRRNHHDGGDEPQARPV